MNEEQQQKIDKQIEKGNTSQKRMRVVEVSDAPIFTDEIIKAKGKKTYTVEFVFDDDIYQIEVKRGLPMEYAILLQVTADVYALYPDKDKDETKEQVEVSEEEKERRKAEFKLVKQLIVVKMVVRTDEETGEVYQVFSLDGTGGNIAIEAQSDLLLDLLYNAVMEVQTPAGYAEALRRFQERHRNN